VRTLDFTEVINFIKDNKGFNNPNLVSHFGYTNGPNKIRTHKIDIPQRVILAKRRSVGDSLRIYMNPKHVVAFMCSFYRGDFLIDPAFVRLEMTLRKFVKDPSRPAASIDNKYTLDLDNPKRKRKDRVYFTNQESKIVQHVCRALPELRTTVLAFQVGFLAYLDRLKEEIYQAPARTSQQEPGKAVLTLEESRRGQHITSVLAEQWRTPNFVSELLPAICLAYFKRDPNLKSTLNSEDFEKGFAFALRIGVFQNHVLSPNGEDRHFVCPAIVTIGTVSMRELGQEVCGHPNQDFLMGRILNSIYTEVINRLHPQTPKKQAARSNRLRRQVTFADASC
jgi:hypothetical protein